MSSTQRQIGSLHEMYNNGTWRIDDCRKAQSKAQSATCRKHIKEMITTDYMHQAHSWLILRISVEASKHYNSLQFTSVLIEAVQHLNFMTSRPDCHTEDASFQELMRWVIEFQAFHWHTSSTYDICQDTNPARDLCKARTWWALTCVFEKKLFLIADIKVGRSWYFWQERGCQLLNSFAPLFCN